MVETGRKKLLLMLALGEGCSEAVLGLTGVLGLGGETAALA